MSASEKISKEVQMTRDTFHYVKDARLKYKEDLCQKRQEEENERNSLKRKIVDNETKQITAKYCALQGEIKDLTISADKLALKAEKHKNFTYWVESDNKKLQIKKRQWN